MREEIKIDQKVTRLYDFDNKITRTTYVLAVSMLHLVQRNGFRQVPSTASLPSELVFFFSCMTFK